MKKTIEELTINEKVDLVEYCAYKIYQLKELLRKAKTDLDKSVLDNYARHLEEIITKVKESLYEQN